MTTRRARVLTALDALDGGDHVGWIVQQPARFAEMAARCLQQGAADGQKVFFFTPRRDGPPHPPPIADGVVVLDPHEAFLRGGALDAPAMYAGFRGEVAAAVAEGYRGIRVVADMDWLLGPRPPRAQMAAFELGLDALAAQTGATIVCAYRGENFPRRDLAEVLCVHPHELGTAPQDLGFRIWSSGEGRWHLSGEVDLGAADAFRAALGTAAEGRDSLSLECSALRFIDVAGLRCLAQISDTGISVRLHGASETLRRCWRLLEWDSSVPGVEFCA